MAAIASSTSSQKHVNSSDPLEQFKGELRGFSTHFTRPWEIDQKLKVLFQKDLKDHELPEILKFIVEECNHTSLLINELLLQHSSCLSTLSPFEQIRVAIAKDGEHALNNDSLMGLFKDHQLPTSQENLAACFELAYRINHPHIYPAASTTVSPSEYTLNFLWVNLNPQDRLTNIAQNIFKMGEDPSENAESIKDPQALRLLEIQNPPLKGDCLKEWQDIKKSFAYRISKWADINPNAQINVWYDSALVTQNAQQKTFEMMAAIAESRRVNLKLRDVRSLPNLKGELEHSLHPGTPLYFRVDLLKALIMDYIVSSSEESVKYCVISDIDVEPMPPGQIFDQRTLDFLTSKGYVFHRAGLFNFENSFCIFNKENKELREIHRQTVIEETANIITLLRTWPKHLKILREHFLESQYVFSQYGKGFQKKLNESDPKSLKNPRKVVKSPISQFDTYGGLAVSDHQSERFRFIGDSNIPHTKWGRNQDDGEPNKESPIEALKNWQAEPLPPPTPAQSK